MMSVSKATLPGARRLLWSLLFLVSGLALGCDSGGGSDPIATGPPSQSPRVAPPNPTLTVNLRNASSGVAGLSSFQVIAYNVRGAQLAQLRVALNQNAPFEDLPAGPVQFRVIGRAQDDTILGFSDLSGAVPGDSEVVAPRLVQTDRIPPRATPGAPFLAFTRLPAAFEAGVVYSIEVSAFDAQGQLDASASDSLGMSSSGVSAVIPEIGVLFNNGRAVFSSLSFPQGSNGSVTFTASSRGYQPATSPTLPVRSNQ